MSTSWREGCGDAYKARSPCGPALCVSTPMKIPRTTNEKYAIIRAEEEEQRKRKTSVKREATVTPTACRRIMLTPDVAIHTIQLPCEDSSVHTPTPLPGSDSTSSVTTPHARPFESQPNSHW
jgi:hypothetical protein